MNSSVYESAPFSTLEIEDNPTRASTEDGGRMDTANPPFLPPTFKQGCFPKSQGKQKTPKPTKKPLHPLSLYRFVGCVFFSFRCIFIKLYKKKAKSPPQPGGHSSCRAACAAASRPCVSNAAFVRGCCCCCSAPSPAVNGSRFVRSGA